MKRYILDTNIILKDPSILTRWSSNYRLIIPDIVIEETNHVSVRLSGSKNLSHLLDDSRSKGFVKVSRIDRNKHPFNETQAKEFKISYADFQIAHFAKDYAKDSSNVVLVTEDRKLASYAENIGVNTQNLFGFQNDIQSSKTVDINDVNATSNIKHFQIRHLAVSFIAGILLTVLIYALYAYFDVITSRFPVWGSIGAFSIIPFVFYWFRSNLRIAYAIAEFAFGYFTVLHVVDPFSNDFKISKIYELAVIFPIMGGIYVMVRGLDNFSKGIQGTIIERYWRRIFKE